jgi:uncharacterized membrane protein
MYLIALYECVLLACRNLKVCHVHSDLANFPLLPVRMLMVIAGLPGTITWTLIKCLTQHVDHDPLRRVLQ